MSDRRETAEIESLELSAEDIEAAYHRALEAMSAVEQAVPELAADVESEPPNEATSEPAAASPVSEPQGRRPSDSLRSDREPRQTSVDAASAVTEREQVVQPRQVVEAALFVGGEPLTAKRLAKLLGENTQGEEAERIIARLNEQYLQERRPYEICLEEGGYRLTLRLEYERVRDRVYGRSPKEVKLSQEALEVLAFVAYQQPARCQDIEDAGKTNAASVLRQLLRRQLVSLRRGDDPSADVTYVTTPRFLDVFGLRNLDELPLPDDLALK